MPLILLAVIAGVPVVLALMFRVSAVFLFLSLMIGDLLVKFVSDDASLVLGSVLKNAKVPMAVELGLLLAPVVLTLLVLRRSMPASKLFLHILPLVLTGLSIAVLTIPLLASSTQAQIFETSTGSVFKRSQDLIIGITSVTILLLAWQSHKHRPDKHGKHHK